MMNRRVAGLTLLVMLSGIAEAKDKDKLGAKAIVAGKVGEALDDRVKLISKDKGGFCGTAFVARKGKVLLYKGYGYADAAKKQPIPTNAMWDWASTSKQFTAAALLKLEMMKKLKLSDPITKFYPRLAKGKESVTLLHIMSHTSGMKPYPDKTPRVDYFKRDEALAPYLRLPVKAAPGETWEYSNPGFEILAAVVEKASGMRFEDFCVKYLFQPAGMKAACFIGMKSLDLRRVPKDDRGRGVPFAYGNRLSWGYRGAGGAVCSAADMYRWDRALRGTKVLNAAAKKKLYTPILNGYALGWFVRREGGETYVSHGGAVGKTVTEYLRLLKADVVVALVYSYEPEHNPGEDSAALVRISAGRR